MNYTNLHDSLWVRQPLLDLYRTHPRPVIELLMRIIDGATPEVSARAAGYAIELLEGPGVGVVVVRLFVEDETTYDTVRKDSKITELLHWIRKVNERLNEKVPPK